MDRPSSAALELAAEIRAKSVSRRPAPLRVRKDDIDLQTIMAAVGAHAPFVKTLDECPLCGSPFGTVIHVPGFCVSVAVTDHVAVAAFRVCLTCALIVTARHRGKQ